MNNNRLIQVIVIGGVFVLLALFGITTFDNVVSMNQLEGALGTFLAESTAEQTNEPVATETTPEPDEGDTPETGNVNSTAVGKETADQLKVILPSGGDTAFLSKINPEIQVRVELSPTIQTSEIISAKMIISSRLLEDQSTIALVTPVANSTPQPTSSFDGSPKNLTITFGKDQIPPSGMYEAWLIISGTTIPPYTGRLTLQVASEPEKSIQNRLTGASADDTKIVLSAVRKLPSFLGYLNSLIVMINSNEVEISKDETKLLPVKLFDFLRKDHFENPYPLILWEEKGQALPSSCKIIASELVDVENGNTGLLRVSDPDPCQPSETPPVTTLLTLDSIEQAGAYQGTLRIITPDNDQNQVIPITAQVRDSLWYPAIIIFVGSLLFGWAIRNVFGDSTKNEAYLRLSIALARKRIERNRPPIVDKDKLLIPLERAEAALIIGDLKEAIRLINKVNKELNLPAISASVDEINMRKVGEVLDLEIFDNLQRKYVLIPDDPISSFEGSEVRLRLSGVPTAGTITWNVKSSTTNWGLVTKPRYERRYTLPPLKVGDYTLQINYGTDKNPKITRGLIVAPDPQKHSMQKLRRNATASYLVWAVIGTVAGLVFINERVPTFGSTSDYIFVLAFALGLSAASRPIETIIENLQNWVGKRPEQTPSDASAGSSETPNDKNKTSADTEVPVPADLTKKTWEEAKKLIEQAGLTAKPSPDTAKPNWIVKRTEPESPAKINRGGTVTCELEDPGVTSSINPNAGQANKTTGDSGDQS